MNFPAPHYREPSLITAAVSNNAFNFERRNNPQLFIPKLIEGTIADVAAGNEIVFEDFNDDGILRSCKGLKQFVKTQLGQAPTYIFDNHNHAFYFWYLEKYLKNISDGALLIHIDQHKDTRMPSVMIDPQKTNDLGEVFQYTNTILNVGNFIPPAQNAGLIAETIFLDSRYSLDEFLTRQLPAKNIILDIDLDFFAPDSDYIGNDLKLKIIQDLIPKASIITICTSPFFIDQELAISWLGKISKLIPH